MTDLDLVRPGEPGYDESRQVWNAMVDRRPALIARCASPADVAAAIRFGRGAGLDIGVLCGGHSVLGLSVPDGGLMLDLTPMGAVRVDPERRRAWVPGGALLGALDRASQPYGLATTAGNVSHTGVGGLTLGGGMGWLARQLGLACDNVLSYELVTADGELVRATESEHADLFWGLRGGGGNFGVVTEFEFRLHPVGTAALVVDLFYRPDTAAKAMRVWRDLLPEGSRKTTFTAWAGTAGNAGYLPPELHGQPLVSVGYVWVGDPALGGGQLDAVKAAVPPIAERAEELSYLALQQIEDEDQQHRIRRYWKGHYLRTLDDGAIDAFVSRGGSDSPGLPAGSLQSYGGAIADIAPDDTPFGHRDALVEFVGSSRWTDPADDAERIALGRRYGAAMEPYASGVYVNVLSDEGSAGVERAYGAAKMARLAALKDRYDPENVFHLNQNIRPTRVTS